MLRNSLPTIITDKVPGPNACVLLKKRDNALPKALCGYTYPICIKRGEGAMLEDVDGNIFLDFIGGVGVLNIGYSRPEVVKAVQDQAEKYFHCIFNVVAHSGYIELADRLNKLMPCKGDKLKTFFANSGAEAQARGFPQYVPPIVPTGTESIISSRAVIALIGTPPPRDFAVAIISGAAPASFQYSEA